MLIFLFVRYFLSTFQTAEIRRRPDNPETLSQCFLSLPQDTNSFTSCRQTIKAVSRASPPFLCFHFSLTVSLLSTSTNLSLSPSLPFGYFRGINTRRSGLYQGTRDGFDGPPKAVHHPRCVPPSTRRMSDINPSGCQDQRCV